MDFFEVINTRKTIRKYKPDNPPVEDIERIIDSARVAPNANNAQNWKFIAIYNQAIKQEMKQAVLDKYDEIAKWPQSEKYKSQIEGSKHYSEFFADAPVVIAVVELPKTSYLNELMKKRGIPLNEILAVRPDSSLLSIGAAIENMSLTSHALGYGTCWMCAPIIAQKEFNKILNLSDDNKIVSLLTVGKPLDENNSSVLKKQLSEIMEIIE